jgi:hypothetical protein
MRQVIDIERRQTQRWGGKYGIFVLDFLFVVTFVNGDSAEYVLQYTVESRLFGVSKRGSRPKDRIRRAELLRDGREPFSIVGPLANYLKTLLSSEELAECSALSLHSPDPVLHGGGFVRSFPNPSY